MTRCKQFAAIPKLRTNVNIGAFQFTRPYLPLFVIIRIDESVCTKPSRLQLALIGYSQNFVPFPDFNPSIVPHTFNYTMTKPCWLLYPIGNVVPTSCFWFATFVCKIPISRHTTLPLLVTIKPSPTILIVSRCVSSVQITTSLCALLFPLFLLSSFSLAPIILLNW